MVRISPVGLAAAPVANQLSILANFREDLCQPFCIDSSVQPFSQIEYTYGQPILNGTTVFVPITARVFIIIPGDCPCQTDPQVYTEQFYVAFQGQTALPGKVNIESVGRIQNGSDVNCGVANQYSINDSLTITLVPATTPAA